MEDTQSILVRSLLETPCRTFIQNFLFYEFLLSKLKSLIKKYDIDNHKKQSSLFTLQKVSLHQLDHVPLHICLG